MEKMNKTELEAQMSKNPQLNGLGFIHPEYYNLKKYEENNFIIILKNVNAGGFDVKGDYSKPYDFSFTEGKTHLGGGSNVPKLGEARYSDINPGIDDIVFA